MFTQESGAQLPVLRESLGLSGFYFLNFFWGVGGVIESYDKDQSTFSSFHFSFEVYFVFCCGFQMFHGLELGKSRQGVGEG